MSQKLLNGKDYGNESTVQVWFVQLKAGNFSPENKLGGTQEMTLTFVKYHLKQ